MKKLLAIPLALALFLMIPSASTAAIVGDGFTLKFSKIPDGTNTSGDNVYSQLSVDIEQVANKTLTKGALINFTFRNIGTTPAEITEIYFDDGTLFAEKSTEGSPGVDFTEVVSTSPFNLEDGNVLWPVFEPSAGFRFDSFGDGVNNGEFVTIQIRLLANLDLDDVEAAIHKHPGYDIPNPLPIPIPVGVNSLRIGINVTANGSADGDGYLNNSQYNPEGPIATILPEPASLAIWGLGSLFGAVAVYRRKRRAS